MHELSDLAEKYGAVIQFAEGNVVKMFRPGYTTSGARAEVSVRAVWRENLIGWRVRPLNAFNTLGGVANGFPGSSGSAATR